MFFCCSNLPPPCFGGAYDVIQVLLSLCMVYFACGDGGLVYMLWWILFLYLQCFRESQENVRRSCAAFLDVALSINLQGSFGFLSVVYSGLFGW